MLRLLKGLFTGDFHLHEWEIYDKHNCYEFSDAIRPSYIRYTLKCKHCGNIKVFNNK